MVAVAGIANGSNTATPKPKFIEPPYKVGGVFALTGAYSGTDKDSAASLKATINEINAGGGVNGHKLVYRIIDSASDPAKSALAAQQLADQYRPHVMIPDIVCVMALSALPAASKAGIVTFTGCSNGVPTNQALYPRSFVTFPPLARQATNIVSAAKIRLGKNTPLRLGFLHSNDAAGNTEIAHLRKAVISKGGTWVGNQPYSVGQVDVSASMSKLKDAGANIVVLWGQVGSAGVAMKALQDLRWDVQVLGNTGTTSAALANEIPAEYKDNFRAVVNAITIRDAKKGLPPFVKNWLSKVSTDVQTLSVVGTVHDGLTLWKWAVERTKSTDGAVVTRELEKISSLPKAQLPKGLLLSTSPAYSPTSHGLDNANLDRAWGIMTPSKNIVGTYLGSLFTCYCAPIPD